MTILGFLDIKSPAATLATTKENRRSSVRRSLDGSMDVLPVQLQPSNWFESLSPNFSPTDLTIGKDYLQIELKQKQSLLSSLEAELRFLINKNVSDAVIEDLEKRVKAGEAKLHSEEEACLKAYGAVAMEAVKMLIQYYTGGDMSKLLDGDFVGKITTEGVASGLGDIIGFSAEDAANLLNEMIEIDRSNLAYFSAFNELITLGRKMAEAQTGGTQKEIDIITGRIKILTREIDQLLAILMADVVKTNPADSEADESGPDTTLPAPRYNDSSVFMDIVFDNSIFSSSSCEEQTSTYAKLKGSIGRFFTRVNSDAEYATSKSSFVNEMLSSNFTIGLRATKVTIDRGGWFEPLVLTTSKNYQRLNKNIIGGAGLNVGDVYAAFSGDQNKIETDENGGFVATTILTHNADGTPYAFPGYPMSFIIVKDVVIKGDASKISDESVKEFVKASFSSNANIFGFRLNGGTEMQSFVGKSQTSESTSACYIRIPGPQILGWFIELTPEDQATPYESLSQSEFFDEIMYEIKKYGDRMKAINDGKDADGTVNVEITSVKVPVEGGQR